MENYLREQARREAVGEDTNSGGEAVINNIQYNYDNTHAPFSNNGEQINNFNPLDEYVKMVEENKRLYQALLEEKDSKIKMLEEMMKGK